MKEFKIDNEEMFFGPLLPYIRDDDITDINWNGTQLWLDNLKKGKLSKLKYKLYDDMFELVDRYVMTNRKVVAQERVGDDYIYTDGYNFMFYTKNLKINSYGQILENGKEIKVYTKTPLLHLKDRYAELRIYGFKSKYTVCADIDKIQ